MKSEFLSPLLVEQVSETDWRLFRDLGYACARFDRNIIIPAGFVTDFASVPRLPLAYWLTGGTTVKPSVIHDWLYRSCGLLSEASVERVSRADADAIFAEAMVVTGQPAWRRLMMHSALKAFGGASFCSGNNPVTSDKGNMRALGIRPRKSQIVIRKGVYLRGQHSNIKELQ